jgi:predicted RNase H-like HicB family nuclease
MRFEVELSQEEGGLFRATAVVYPDVTATGRTEKEALGLLMEAMERYMKKQAAKGA